MVLPRYQAQPRLHPKHVSLFGAKFFAALCRYTNPLVFTKYRVFIGLDWSPLIFRHVLWIYSFGRKVADFFSNQFSKFPKSTCPSRQRHRLLVCRPLLSKVCEEYRSHPRIPILKRCRQEVAEIGADLCCRCNPRGQSHIHTQIESVGPFFHLGNTTHIKVLHRINSRSEAKQTNWKILFQFCGFLFLLCIENARNKLCIFCSSDDISVTVSLIRSVVTFQECCQIIFSQIRLELFIYYFFIQTNIEIVRNSHLNKLNQKTSVLKAHDLRTVLDRLTPWGSKLNYCSLLGELEYTPMSRYCKIDHKIPCNDVGNDVHVMYIICLSKLKNSVRFL